MRITLRHYYDFGSDQSIVGEDLVASEAWDALRTRTVGPFSIPVTRDEFVRLAAASPEIKERAGALDAWLEGRGVGTLASYGVGGASVEWCLYRLRPKRNLILTDYGPATVERLRALFPEADIHHHDLLRDPPLTADLHLFHRIDTEFTNSQWRAILRGFGSLPVLFVASDLLDLRRVLHELRAGRALKRQGATRAGFIRTRAALEALWRPTHTADWLRVHDLDAWALHPRRGRGVSSDLRVRRSLLSLRLLQGKPLASPEPQRRHDEWVDDEERKGEQDDEGTR